MTPARLAAICAARVFLFSTFMTVAAVIPLLMQEWRLGAAAAGAIVSAFTVSYALSVFGFAWAADHFGAKRMVVASALAAAAAGAAFALFARDWGSAIVLYALVGLAQGGVYTPLIMVIADEVAPARRGNAMGWLIASTSVGYAGSLGAAAIGVSVGGLDAAFLLSGLLPALGAAMLGAALGPFANRVHARAPGGGGLADELLRNRESRLLTLGYTGHSWEVVGMWAWIPAFLAAGFALKGAGAAGATASGAWLAGLLHVFGALAALTMGRLSDRAGRRPVLVVLAAAGALVSFTLGWLVHAPSIVLVPLAIAYAFLTLGDSPVLTTAISEAVRPAYLGGVLAWRGLAGFGAGAVAPLAFGLILDETTKHGPAVSWGLGFATLGLGGAAALACALLLRQHRPHAVAHRPHHVAGQPVRHEKGEQH
jgi:MFS family permease